MHNSLVLRLTTDNILTNSINRVVEATIDMKKSLPAILYSTLEQHAKASDIDYDDELVDIMSKLTQLNDKVEALKQIARAKKAKSNIIDFPQNRT